MMVTKLKVVKSQIIGGRTINCDVYETKNQTLHLLAKPLSKTLIYSLECDSNNTTSVMVPTDTVTFRDLLELFKEELEFSNDPDNLTQPRSAFEKTFKILVPTEVEMKRYTNSKCERYGLAIQNLLAVLLGVDSTGTKGFVGAIDHALVKKSYEVCVRVADKWIGTGIYDDKAKKFNTGLDIPPLLVVGQIDPDNDLDAATVNEPSTGRTKGVHRPDAPDTPAIPEPVVSPPKV